VEASVNEIIRILPAILLALALTGAQDKTVATPKDAAEKMLIANERSLHDAVAKGDKAAFRSLVLPAGQWTTKQGFVPMQVLAGGLDGFRVTKWEIVNPRVTSLGDDSALVTYVWTGSGTFGDQPLAPTTLAATVWARRDGKWLAVHHQQTELVRN
jgi:hypothetical protein